jgi:hypothetical protein
MSNDALAIRGFTDAIAEVLAIQQQFRQGHAAAILDQAGALLDLTVFAAPHHSMDDALDWADCLVRGDERAARLVLFSAITVSVREPCEADLNLLRRARACSPRRA